MVGQVIGAPTNFSHDTHVGWDTDRGFELRNIPAEWQRLFSEAGVNSNELQDPATRAFLVDTVRQSIMVKSGPVGAPAPAPPPPPMMIGAPPPPSMGGGPAGGGMPIKKVDPFAIGTEVLAMWSGDQQFYKARIDGVKQEDGAKVFTVTFIEYGNQEDVAQENVKSEKRNGLGSSGGGGGKGDVGMAALLQAQAGHLRPPDLTELSAQEEEGLVSSVQKALEARRKGMCFSVYGHDAVDENKDEWEDEGQDESWMDF